MIREWEEQNGAKRIKICAVTADANSETQDRCLSEEGGFDEFLTKPLRKNALWNMITQCCGEDRLVEETGTVSRSKTGKTQPEAASVGASHVLIVDDTPSMRLLLKTYLTGMGCIVSEASSGESAVELVRSSFADKGNAEPIEMVLCDIRMPPGINGIETSRRIKQIPGASELPIIGMTADDVSNEALQEAQGVGMASLVSKPLGKASLVRFLADHTDTVASTCLKTEKDTDDRGSVFDEDKALDMCSGDKALLKTLLTDIVKDLSLRGHEIRTAVQRKDTARVAEIAHNIKGMALMCGFTRLAKASNECQNCAAISDYIETRTRSQVVLDEMSRASKAAEVYPG